MAAMRVRGKCTDSHQHARGPIACGCTGGNFTEDDYCGVCGHDIERHEQLLSSPFSPSKYPVDPATQPREQLCKNLFDLLQRKRVVHARGTPTSGKSVFSKVFYNYVNLNFSETGMMAYRVRAIPYGNGETIQALQRRMSMEAQYPFAGMHSIDSVPNLFIIIDEGQNTYEDFEFWDSLNADNKSQTRYLILGSWGSPTRKPVDSVFAASVQLDSDQQIGFCHGREGSSMLFTLDEHADAINRWLQSSCENPKGFGMEKKTIEYLYRLTNGHAGTTRGSFQCLITEWTMKPTPHSDGAVISHVFATELFEDSGFIHNTLAKCKECGRGFMSLDQSERFVSMSRQHWPGDTFAQADFEKTILDVLIKGQAIKPDSDNESDQQAKVVSTLHKAGALQSELEEHKVGELIDSVKVVYVFPTILHARFYEHEVYRKPYPFPYSRYSSLQKLILPATQLFSSMVIGNPANHQARLGPGAVPRDLEAVYCDELYRTIHLVLGGRYMQREWSGPKSNRRIDFRIMDRLMSSEQSATIKMPWGIECLRDGVKLTEHIERFAAHGDYWQYIQDGLIGDFAILDFRVVESGCKLPDIEQLPRDPFIYYVIFYQSDGDPHSLPLQYQIHNKGMLIDSGFLQS